MRKIIRSEQMQMWFNRPNEVVAEMKESLEEEGFEVAPDREIVALIAYLQRLGVDIEKGQTAEK